MQSKIAIATWLATRNFGTCLQAYALQRVLRESGYDAVLLTNLDATRNLKSRIISILSCFGITQLKDWIERKIKRDRFLNGHLPHKISKWCKKNYITRSAYRGKQLNSCIKDYDCFLSGSDQIWNSNVAFSPPMFLNCVDGKKRISYASSIGTNTIPSQYQQLIKDFLRQYSHISLREKSGARAVAELTGRRDIKCTLDPTLLLSRDQWTSILDASNISDPPSRPYIFCYFLSNRKHYKAILGKVKSILNIERTIGIHTYKNSDLEMPDIEYHNACDPFEFLNLLRNSAVVVTDSFHATIFSVIFEKRFFTLERFNSNDCESQNSRIENFLDEFNLRDRYLTTLNIIPNKEINFHPVREKLTARRKESLAFLVSSIEN